MVDLLEAELAEESARAIRDVAARHRGEELSVKAVEALIRAGTALVEQVLSWSREGLAFFDKGLEGRTARPLLTAMLAACRSCREAVAVIEQEAARVESRTGHSCDSFARLAGLARDLAKVERAASSLDELANRPVQPVAAERLGHGAAAYERGQTEDVQDLFAGLRAGQPL